MTKATELAQLGGLVDVTVSGNTSGGNGGSGIVLIAYPS